ncbi:MAG: flagellar hook-associated protein FlgL, partial [Gammaproteobacteria bacterium]
MRVSNNQNFFRSLNGMLDIQREIQKFQLQIATGKRILKSADDPVAAAQSLQLSDSLAALEQYDRNANLATLRLSEQESGIAATQNVLQRVRELILQAKNGSLTTTDRRFIATEVGERLNEVLQIGNRKNASGEFIFAGTAVDTLPFASDASGSVVYAGNDIVRELEIADGRTVAEALAGSEIFMAVRNGNGIFVTGLGAGNTGTGRLINDSITNLAAFTTDRFHIAFTAANTYDVINDTSGATVLSAQPYIDGSAIAFNGISVAVTGAPNIGDTFTVGPSLNQS